MCETSSTVTDSRKAAPPASTAISANNRTASNVAGTPHSLFSLFIALLAVFETKLPQPLDDIQVGQSPIYAVDVCLSVRCNQHGSDKIGAGKLNWSKFSPECALAGCYLNAENWRRQLSATHIDRTVVLCPTYRYLARFNPWNIPPFASIDRINDNLAR